MEISTINVIILSDGILNSVQSFSKSYEAEEVFVSLIKAREENVSDEDIQFFLDSGNYDDASGYNVVLAHSEGGKELTGESNTVGGVIEHLLGYSNMETPITGIFWGDDDVKFRAKDLEVEITDKEVENVLGLMDKNHDGCYGITWDTIDDYILMVVAERPDEEGEEDNENVCTECGHTFERLVDFGGRKVCSECNEALEDQLEDLQEIN